MDQLDFGPETQSQILVLLIADEEFLTYCINREIRPAYFPDPSRQRLCRLIIEYYNRHQSAPGFNNLSEVISVDIAEGLGMNDDLAKEMYLLYSDLSDYPVEIAQRSKSFLMELFGDFIKKRIISQAIVELNKLVGRSNITSDRFIDIMREAVLLATQSDRRKVLESLRTAPTTPQRSNIMTRFNVLPIDSYMGGGFVKGDYGIILGFTNIGKSWCTSHLSKHAARLGNTPLIIDTERPNRTVRVRLQMCFTGMTKEELMDRPSEVKDKIGQSMVKKSNVVLLADDEKSIRVDQLKAVIEEVEREYLVRPNPILIDSVDDMEPPLSKYSDKIDRSTAKHVYVKNLAKEEDLCIITTVQAQRRAEHKWWLGAGTVGDDINKIRKATIGISINGTPNEVKAKYSRLYLFKNSNGPVGARVWIKNNFSIGQFVVNWGEYNYIEYKELLKASGVELESHGR